jgi:hypothetical protein
MTRRALLALVALALATRLAHLAWVHDEPYLRFHRGYVNSDMYFFDQWAQRIAAGDWLGRAPYLPLARWQAEAAPQAKWDAWYGTLPVFYKGPFYAYLIAGLYRLFSDPTLPLVLLQIAASALAVGLLAALTARTFGPAAGLFAGGLFALHAPAIHFDMVMLRGPWVALTALLVSVCLQRVRERPTAASGVWLGAAVAIAMTVNEAFLVLPPLVLACLPWLAPRRSLPRLALALAGGMLVALAPVVARNVVVGVPPFALAVTGGTVYAVYNSAGSSPYFLVADPSGWLPILERSHGALVPTVLACQRSFGSVGAVVAFYLRKSIGVLVPFENPDNLNFYYAQLWSPLLRVLPGHGVLMPLALVGGVVARRRWREALVWAPPGIALLVSLFVALPASRYRATFAVFLFPFAGLACAALLEAIRERRRLRALSLVAAALAVALLAQILERRVVFAGLEPDRLRYRAPEFILGSHLRAERGDVAGAARELLELARRNPDRQVEVNAMVLLAEIALRAGDGPAVAGALGGATRLAAGEPTLLMAVGDAYLRLLGDRARALDLYREAMALAPPALREALERRLSTAPHPP